MLALDRIPATRIAAAPAALDSAVWPEGTRAFRIAPDEILLTPPVEAVSLNDPHAIVVADSGFAGGWLPLAEALPLLERTCEWELPSARPAFAQGAIAGVAAKLWIEADRILFIVPAPLAHDFMERMR